ncbi:hypothetical protein [Bacillus salipaludis]|uniref:Uncharacterized protein n=1 Tax=Bacillus salipaludis TaxID=2547811 RepID=A0ABW8RF89_9BACI
MISKSIILFSILKWVGVAYLLYIGVKTIMAGAHQSRVDNNFVRSNKLLVIGNRFVLVY